MITPPCYLLIGRNKECSNHTKSLGFEKSQVFYLGRGDKEECTKLNTYEVFYYQAGIE